MYLQQWIAGVDWASLEVTLHAHFKDLREVRIVTERPNPLYLCKTQDEALPEQHQLQISQGMPRLAAEGILRFPRPIFRGYR